VWCMFLVKDKKKASLRTVEWEVATTTEINRWAMFLFYISFILFFSLWCVGWWAHEHMEKKDLAWYVELRLQILIIQPWMKIVMPCSSTSRTQAQTSFLNSRRFRDACICILWPTMLDAHMVWILFSCCCI
jgi:hypothetical protein